MGSKPNKNWGVGEGNIPETAIDKNKITPVPFFTTGKKTFKDKNLITLGCIDKDAKIYYTFAQGGKVKAPIEYKAPFEIDKTSEIHVYAENPNYGPSKIVVTKFYKVDINKNVQLISEPGSLYKGSGPEGLIDGIRGENDFRLGEWQGFMQKDFEAIVELKEKKEITKLSSGFLQDNYSWIFMPQKVEYYSSDDGKNFTKIAEVLNDVSAKEGGTILKDFTAEVNIEAKYIKVVGKNMGKCPEWHKGYEHNGNAWLFIDEIIIE